MATRNERVVLTLDDQFSGKMARAAAATALLKRELDGVDGKTVFDDTAKSADGAGASVEKTTKKTKDYSLEMAVADEKSARLRKSLREQARAALDAEASLGNLGDELDQTGDGSAKAGNEIDKLSGRLRLLTDAAFTLGPALVPLGAATIPVLVGALAGLGAAAGGIGVAVLAFNGIGDGIKAITDYDLEPTAENLQALRVEMEKLGPAGAEFANYISDLGPQMRELQNVAREGLFPGVEAGIDDLLTRLPEVTKIVNRISQTMGGLASDAGASLGGPDFDSFFKYLKTDAAPTLEAFARSAGNVGLGLANMLVAFAPATRDFTSGLEDMTKRFAEWSAGLDDNQSFQDFLSYVRESGPEAVKFLGAIGGALVGLIRSSAGLGQATLPALTAMAKAFSAIANSPIGPVLSTAVAALLAFNRVSKVTGGALKSMSASFDSFGTKAATTQQKLSRFGAVGAGIVTAGVAVGMLADNINRIDPANLDRSLTALQFGDVTDTVDKVIDSLQQLNSPLNKIDLGEIVTVGGLFGDSSLDKFADNIDQVDQSLAQMVESGNADQAALLFQRISDLADARGVDPAATAKQFDAYALALDNVAAAAGNASGLSALLGGSLHGAGDAADDAAAGAQRFSDALAGLNGWLDKREALRGYRDGLAQITKGLENGFGRKDVENIDAVGRSITQVASLIKDRGVRADFLAGARASLVDLANKSGPKARAEIQELIGALDRYGLTKPKAPKLDVDDKPARNKGKDLQDFLNTLVGHPYDAKVTADTGQAVSAVQGLLNRLGLLHDRTVRVNTVFSQSGHPGGDVPPAAGGTTVPKTGLPYADRHPYLLADGEEVISNRHGQADRHRSLLKAINAGRLADGGTTGLSTYVRRSDAQPSGDAFHELGVSAQVAAALLNTLGSSADGLKAKLAKSEKALDRQTSALESLTSQRDSLSSSATSSLLHDPFGNGLTGLQAQVAADSADAQAMLTALQALVRNGLDPKGALFQALAASGDVNTAQQLAQLSATDLSATQAGFADRGTLAGQVGSFAGDQSFGKAIAAQTKVVDRLDHTVSDLQKAVKAMEQAAKDMPGATGSGVFQAVKDGQSGKDKSNAAFTATNARPMGRR